MQKEETKILKLVIDYIGSVIDYKSLCLHAKFFPVVIDYMEWACGNRLPVRVIDYHRAI